MSEYAPGWGPTEGGEGTEFPPRGAAARSRECGEHGAGSRGCGAGADFEAWSSARWGGGAAPVSFVRPVEVARGGFAFCRWSLAAALWTALFFHQWWLVALTGAVLAASAALGVERSPMIVLWRATGHRLLPTREVVLDRRAMRFAHAAGAFLCAVALSLLLAAPGVGRGALLVVALLKTVGAFGFCTASKLYACAARGGCCATIGRRHA